MAFFSSAFGKVEHEGNSFPLITEDPKLTLLSCFISVTQVKICFGSK